jgi:hypothetical protein
MSYYIDEDFQDNAIHYVFNPYIRLDSGNSIKSNDLYFSRDFSVSKQNMDNIPKKIEAFPPIDDFNSNFKNLFSSEDNNEQDSKLEKADNDNDNSIDISFENNFKEFNFEAPNLFNQNIRTFLIEEDESFARIMEPEIKEKKDDKISNTKTETNDKLPPSIKPIEKEEPEIKKKTRGKRGPYKKKPKPIIKTKTNDNCFPFRKGKGLLSDDSSDNKLKQYMNTIFRTNIYVTDSNGNKKKEKKQRKFKPDDIRKKIKVRFHKKIKNIINENLKKAGSTELFSFLPQYFISNIAKKFNNQYMNMTYEELLKINFSELQDKYPNKDCDNNQYGKNKKTLEYLEKNPHISEISGFDKVKKMKYKDIFKAYFSSAEFEESIATLKEEDESAEYIQEYFILAKNYIDYFINIDD